VTKKRALIACALVAIVSAALAATLAIWPTPPPTTPYIVELSEGLLHKPDDPNLLADRGFAYAMLGYRRPALADFEKALALDPNNLCIHWSYGWALFNLSDYGKALSEWNHVIGHTPRRPWWVGHTLAICYWQLGDRAEAVKYYDEAVQRNPGRFSTKRGLMGYTDFWTEKERAVIGAVFDAWDRGYKLHAPKSDNP